MLKLSKLFYRLSILELSIVCNAKLFRIVFPFHNPKTIYLITFKQQRHSRRSGRDSGEELQLKLRRRHDLNVKSGFTG